jgi:hypothetical protein
MGLLMCLLIKHKTGIPRIGLNQINYATTKSSSIIKYSSQLVTKENLNIKEIIMNNLYPIIDNMEVLEPKVVIMRKGGTSPSHANVYTQREWNFIQQCMNGGVTVIVNLRD